MYKKEAFRSINLIHIYPEQGHLEPVAGSIEHKAGVHAEQHFNASGAQPIQRYLLA